MPALIASSNFGIPLNVFFFLPSVFLRLFSNKLLDNEVKNQLKESIGAYIKEVETIIDEKKKEEDEKKKKRKEKKDAHDALVQEQIDNYLKTIEK